MINLRNIERTIEKFEFLVRECPEIVKEDLDDFSMNAKVLNDILRFYLEELNSSYRIFCDYYEEISQMREDNIFFKIVKKKKIKDATKKIQYFTQLIEEISFYKGKMEKIVLRINQFIAFS